MAEINHKDRAHAKLSASGASRWTACPGSVRMEENFPDTSSVYAKEGTLAHEISELKLKHYLDPKGYGKRKLNEDIKKLKTNELYQKAMDGYTDYYVDFIKEKAMSFDTKPYIEIEKRVDFSKWVPDGFGTCDCIMIQGNTLVVIDLKYGKGVPVSAEDNKQLILYALGAYAAFEFIYEISNIELNIVQPRLDSISTWSIPMVDLLIYGEFFKQKATEALSDNAVLNPSADACKFCKAKSVCIARADKNVELHEFTTLKPEEIPKNKLFEYISKGEDVEKWIKSLKEYALKMCLEGQDIKGLKAVSGRTSRSWKNQDEALKKLIDGGIEEALIYDRVPLTLAQLETQIGKKQFNELVGDMVVVSSGKPALAYERDKRPAISNVIKANDVFKKI